MENSFLNSCAVSVGGVGGSGTRLVARGLAHLGFFLGHDLNEELDNLSFTLLFKRLEIIQITQKDFDYFLDIFIRLMRSPSCLWSESEREAIIDLGSNDRINSHDATWLKLRAEKVLGRPDCNDKNKIAWKEPNSHIVLPMLMKSMPNLKYIHVRRNGLDMAFSKNQNQPRLWGGFIVGDTFLSEETPRYSLKYWCAAERRIDGVINTDSCFKKCHVVDFDNLCLNPQEEWLRLLHFLEVRDPLELIDDLSAMVIRPLSLGRYRYFDKTIFDPDDLAYAQSLCVI